MILNYIHWNPDPEIINVFGISIRYYGLLFVSGLILFIAIVVNQSFVHLLKTVSVRYFGVRVR